MADRIWVTSAMPPIRRRRGASRDRKPAAARHPTGHLLTEQTIARGGPPHRGRCDRRARLSYRIFLNPYHRSHPCGRESDEAFTGRASPDGQPGPGEVPGVPAPIEKTRWQAIWLLLRT